MSSLPSPTPIDINGFPCALVHLLNGSRVTRSSWPAGTFLYLVPGSTFAVSRPPLMGIFPEGTSINYANHIDIRDGSSDVCGVWTPTQPDLFADDWVILP